jgi:hypothetical protein
MEERQSLTESGSGGAKNRGVTIAIAIVLVVLLGVAGLVLFFVYAPITPGFPPDLVRELRDRGRIAVVGQDSGRLDIEGAQLLASRDVRGLDAALNASDEDALEALLAREGIAGILIDTRRPSNARSRRIGDRLRSFDRFEVLHGAYLTPGASLYLRRRGLRIERPLGDAMARAARQILGGSRLPNVRSFPEQLRRTRNVEVLVLLRQGGRPRLWRSARGGSIARALVTAASVARERWAERQPAMGGPIEERLASLDVEVYLLEDDGTVGDRSAAFIERVFTDRHGVAFEDGGSWHYLLPTATKERGHGSALRAYRELFDDAGKRRDSLGQVGLRPYRLVARLAGTSPAPSSSSPSRDLPDDSALDLPSLDGIDAL